LVTEWSQRNEASALIGRIANLYGPGQNISKPQGIISQICRSYLLGYPLSIYVSLDTLRDYIFAPDCAALVADALLDSEVRAQSLDRWLLRNPCISTCHNDRCRTWRNAAHLQESTAHRDCRSEASSTQARDLSFDQSYGPNLIGASSLHSRSASLLRRRTSDANCKMPAFSDVGYANRTRL